MNQISEGLVGFESFEKRGIVSDEEKVFYNYSEL
jgi:hypothetical protein